MENEIKCPKCGSTQITAQKQGFGAGKAAAGVLLTGGIGLLAGGINSNKIKLTCLSCGNQFNPGEDKDALAKKKEEQRRANAAANEAMRKNPKATIVICIAAVLFMVYFLKSCLG